MTGEEQYAAGERGETIFYDFRCPGCGSEGRLGVPKSDRRVGCPDECGAVFIQWQPPGKPPALRCVVQPCFE